MNSCGGIGIDLELAGDLIGTLESKTIHSAHENVGIATNLQQSVGPKLIADLLNHARAQAQTLQERQFLTVLLLGSKRRENFFSFLGANALDRTEPFGRIFQNLKGVGSELLDNALGEFFADAGKCRTDQVTANPFCRDRWHPPSGLYLELPAMLRMLTPSPFQFDGIAFAARREVSSNNRGLCIRISNKLSNGESLIRTLKDDSSQYSAEDFCDIVSFRRCHDKSER